MESSGLSPAVIAALDRYEAEARSRVGASAAREHRRELEAHLRAEIAARLELGVSAAEAETAALAQLGDLASIAKAEPTALPDARHSTAALAAAVGFFYLAWFVPQVRPMAPAVGYALFGVWFALLLAGSLGSGRIRWSALLAANVVAWAATNAYVAIASFRELGHVQVFPMNQYLLGYVVLGAPSLILHAIVVAIRRAAHGRRLRVTFE